MNEQITAAEPSRTHLWFLECLDQVNRSIQAADDLDAMLRDVLDAVLTIFDCDRAWLLYPCDPNAGSWQVPMERTKPQYPGALAQKLQIPTGPESAEVFKIMLESNGPVKFGIGNGYRKLPKVTERFGPKSILMKALYPKGDKPWLFGLHQCSYSRIWAKEDERLFIEIGRRLTDGLTSLLAHRSLMESEEKYRGIVETAAEGICMLGPDAIITFANARMSEILGYSVEEMKGKHVASFLFEEDIPHHRKTLEELRQGALRHIERRLRRKDGRIIWMLVAATPIFDNEHRFNGAVAMFTDITERKQAEVALLEAKEASDSIARIKSRFLDIAAHELRTPVTSFSLMIEFARKQLQSGHPLEMPLLDRMHRQAKRLRSLAVELLDVSRLDRGVMTLHREPVDIVSLISSAVEEVSVQAPTRRIDFDMNKGHVEIDADPLRIHQVLSNLLDNAIKYTPEDSPIEVVLEPLPERVRVSVTDHGPGIPEERQAELFNPFTRGNSDREERTSGLGLGLFVCRGIIGLHGGTIGLKSEPNVGSTFYFDLPRKKP